MRIKLYSKPYYAGAKVLEGIPCQFLIRWNTYTEQWYMDFIAAAAGVTIRGIALTGGHDLLAPFGYSNIFGSLEIVDNSGRDEPPEFEQMGSRWTLEYTPLS